MRLKTSKLQFVGKIQVVLLIWLFMPLLAWTGVPGVQMNDSEDKVKITLTEQGVSLKNIINKISAQTSYHFAYDEHLLDINKTLNITVKEASLEQVLKIISQQYPLKFKRIGHTIHMMPMNKPKSKPVGFQEIKVTGKVTAGGEGLPGVNVLVKGSSIGTVTDVGGNYSINVPNEDDILVFSSIGYITQEVPVNGRTSIDVVLAEDVQSLEEVVVVGYGERKDRSITGSVAKISEEDLGDLKVVSPDQALAGQSPGVQVVQTSGQPGSAPVIKIRGTASLNADGTPLYVIDGFPVSTGYGNLNSNPLAALNPNDIESMTVLKDAASAAIYGSRAANGVVIITTKSAKEGITKLNIDYSAGLQQIPGNYGHMAHQLMSAREFAEFKTELIEDEMRRQGEAIPNDGSHIPEDYRNPESIKGTNWFDEITRVAPSHSLNVSFSNGTKNSKSLISLGYDTREGVIKETSFDRLTARINVSTKFTDNITAGINFNGSLTNNKFADVEGPTFQKISILAAAYGASPIAPVRLEDGSLNPYIQSEGTFGYPNPLLMLKEIENHDENFRTITNSFVQVDPFEGLTLKSTLGLDLQDGKYRYYRPSNVPFWMSPGEQFSYSTIDNTRSLSWINENTATYNTSINDAHNLDILVGFTAQKWITESTSATGQDFADNVVKELGNAALANVGSGTTETSLLSILGRINYDYKDKYLVSVAFRRDGSSRFGPNNRWGNFPSVSLGWRISEESFMRNMPVIEDMKLRASYGEVGNFAIGDYQWVSRVNTQNYVFGNELVPGKATNSFGNKDLTWEVGKQVNLGMDISLFENRVSFSLDYYNARTTNMLFTNIPVPTASGFSSAVDNLGEIENKGVELGVFTKNLVREFKWETNLNISVNKNKVLALNQTNDPIIVGLGLPVGTHKTVVGLPIGTFYGLHFIGLWNSEEDFDKYPENIEGGVNELGGPIFADMDGDGIYDPERDAVPIGDPYPDFTFGITNRFSYKNFDLSVLMNGAVGGQILSMNYVWAITNYNAARNNGITLLKERWRSPDNPGNGEIPYASHLNQKAFRGRGSSDNLILQNNSYLNIRNVTLSYTLPNNISDKAGFIDGVKLYLNIENAYLFSQYKIGNPEISTGNTAGGSTRGAGGGRISASAPGNALTPGTDHNSYPIPRMYRIGVNFSF